MSVKSDLFENAVLEIKQFLKDYLEQEGAENVAGRYYCINPDHDDKHPSATVFTDDNGGEHLKCWSCLPYHEMVKTDNGYVPIGEINIGDNVFTKKGRYRKVYNKIATKNKECKNYVISTYSYHPGVELTEDHSVFVIPDSVCDKSYTDHFCNGQTCSYLVNNRCKTPNFKNIIVEKLSSEISLMDMLVYPIYVPSSFYNGEDILDLPIIDKDLFWLFGIYLAEGNTFPRVVEFTLHEDEELFILNIVQIAKKYFNANYSFKISENSKAFKVRIHSSKFQKLLDGLFGTGCLNKKIPEKFYDLNDSFKKFFIDGIFDGDGCKSNRKLTLVNKNIIRYYYDALLYFGEVCSFSSSDEYTDINGITHQKTYSVYPFSNTSYRSFFVEIEGIRYLASGVMSVVSKENTENMVYDISVEEDESFVTSGFVVHNCGHTSDIFAACHVLENKPISGTGFFAETIPYLATRFNVTLPEYVMSESERDYLTLMRLYQDAHNYITSYSEDNIPANVKAELDKRGWTDIKKIQGYGVGFVRSYEDFRRYLRSMGHTIKIIEESGLNNIYLFTENRLIYTYFDEHGKPVGFIARNLVYDGIRDEDSGMYLNGPKYFFNKNPTNGIKLIKKEQRFYLFDRARKSMANTVYIVEGQPDTLSFHYYGYDNFAGLSGVYMSLEHFELLRRYGVYDIVICFDNDAPGQKAAESLIEMVLKHVSDIRVRFMFLPTGDNGEKIDPELMARDGKFDEFFELPKTNPFDYMLNKLITDTEEHDPELICSKVLPTVVVDPSSIRRETMIATLSNVTGISERALKEEVMRIIENKERRVQKVKQSIIDRMITRVEGSESPVEVESVLAETVESLRQIDKESASNSLEPKVQLGTFLEIKRYEEGDTLLEYPKVDRNLEVFMSAFEGDLSQKVIFCPAPPNVGVKVLLMLTYVVYPNI